LLESACIRTLPFVKKADELAYGHIGRETSQKRPISSYRQSGRASGKQEMATGQTSKAASHSSPGQNPAQVDASDVIAQHLVRTTYADLPPAVVSAVKTNVLDQIGCILSGTGTPDVLAIASLVKEWGGASTCTLIGSGGVRMPSNNAALANGAAVHQYDFDDVHDTVTCHPTASTLVPTLAAAEEKGGVSGKDVILAVALGSDITCRVSRAIVGTHGHPWYRAPVVGMFGATSACAKILGADKDQFLNAFGLALPQIGGTYASLLHHGSSVRSIRDGLAYKNGLLSAQLAMRGLKGDPEVFEGKFGFYNAYYKGSYSRDKLIGGLGEEYETTNVSLKPWPSARHLHTTITAVLGIMEAEKLTFADVSEVIFDVGKVNRERCTPISGDAADAHIDLLANLPYAVAAAIRFNNVMLDAYIDHAVIADVMTHAMPKVSWRMNPEQDGEWRFEPGRVTLKTASGQTHHALAKTALGHPSNPMTEAQQHDKFIRQAALRQRHRHIDEADRIALRRVETCPNKSPSTA
jgi:2-methylcitrate dehydratase PrpD